MGGFVKMRVQKRSNINEKGVNWIENKYKFFLYKMLKC